MVTLIESVLPYLTWRSGTIPYPQLAVTAVMWFLLYYLARQVWRYESPEYCCRIVTFIHGSTVVTISAVIQLNIGPLPWICNADQNLPIHNVVLLLSLGYFLFDITWCFLVGSESPTMLAHHVVSVAGFSYAVYSHRYGIEVTAVCLGAEFTNPLVQFRWFLRHHGYYDTLIGIANDYLFVIAFTFLRFVPGSYMVYSLVTCDKVELPMKVGAVSLYLISVVFLYGVLRFFLRKYVWKTYGKRRNGVETEKDE